MKIERYENGISAVVLNNPEKHNAFDDQLIFALTETIVSLDTDSNTKIILLTAEGKNFSVGADLAWMKRMHQFTLAENVADAMQLANLLKTLSQCSKPTIALAKGKSMGGGVGLLACCDIVIAEEAATFCFSEAKLGLVPATIAPYVVRAIGPRMAQYYFLTAKIFDALEANHAGLVQEVTSSEALFTAGLQQATNLLRQGPRSLSVIKQLVSQIQPLDEKLLAETANLIASVRASEEAQEGISAFFEKRDPNWMMKDK